MVMLLEGFRSSMGYQTHQAHATMTRLNHRCERERIVSQDFYAQLPRRRIGAGVLMTNARGELLLVEPAYKPTWEIPGGIVEDGEDPRTCASREIAEELRLDIPVGRLLVIDHRTDPPPGGDSIMIVYDGGVLAEASSIRLPADELLSFRFVPANGLEQYLDERLAFRIRQSLRAREDGLTVEIVNGVAVD